MMDISVLFGFLVFYLMMDISVLFGPWARYQRLLEHVIKTLYEACKVDIRMESLEMLCVVLLKVYSFMFYRQRNLLVVPILLEVVKIQKVFIRFEPDNALYCRHKTSTVFVCKV